MCRAVVGRQRLPIRGIRRETLERLITDYPGRYRGTASFAGASELMQSRLGFGYQTSRQDFTWAGNRSSQNVIASAPGSSGKFLVLGAHYDTYYGRPTLQGLDDNASGAAVLTEIARNLGGIALENGLGWSVSAPRRKACAVRVPTSSPSTPASAPTCWE